MRTRSRGLGAQDSRRPLDEGNTLSKYLEEISKIPLLTKEEEKDVAGSLTDARQTLLSEYAKIPEAVEEICRWARMADSGEVSFDRYFDVDDSKGFRTTVQRIEKRLSQLKKRGVSAPQVALREKIAADVLKLGPTEPIITKAEECVRELLRARKMELPGSRPTFSAGHGAGTEAEAEAPAPRRKRSRKKADPVLSDALERIRAARQKFEDCRRILTESNLRLAITVAKLYRNRGLPLSDLIQEGNLGLIRACDRFDSRKGYRFSTYAVYWIRQSISRALPEQSRTVRVPPHLTEVLARYLDAKNRLQGTLGREPTEDEILEKLGVASDKVQRAQALPLESFSIDKPFSDEPGAGHWDLPDRSSASPLLDVQRRALAEAVDSLQSVLTEREAMVIGMRFGLCGHREMTLEEIGKQFEVTRERVRQIQAEALRKLRASQFAQLGSYARNTQSLESAAG